MITEHEPSGPFSKPELEKFDSDLRQFARALAMVMDEKGISIEVLARTIVESVQMITLMLEARHRPSMNTVRRLAQALCVEPEELWNDFER